MDVYIKLLSINKTNQNYPFNKKEKDNIEFTKNQLELHYIKKYNKCISDSSEKLEKRGKNETIVFLQ